MINMFTITLVHNIIHSVNKCIFNVHKADVKYNQLYRKQSLEILLTHCQNFGMDE